MVYLGIDYGQAKIGLAIAEDSLPWPLGVWPNKNNLLAKISVLCQKQGVKKIIIGLPEGSLEKEIKEFGVKLAELTSLEIDFHPETLTTKAAIDKMITAGKKKKFRQGKEDAFAAAIILQEYLEKNV
jgi:putative transcription antitermination factor YqgF